MFKALLAVHLVLAVFTIGPLVHAATTAGRGVRHGDGAATAAAARTLRVYAYVSLLVVIAGFGLMSSKRHGQRVADFGDTWIWLSVVLWVIAMGLVLGLAVPTLDTATKRIAEQDSVVTLTGRVAAVGGLVALIFVAVVVVMVYRPGG